MARKEQKIDPHRQAFLDGAMIVSNTAVFARMTGYRLRIEWREDDELRLARGFARVHPDGLIVVNKHARASAQEWSWVLSHCLLHLGFGHLDANRSTDAPAQAAACLAVVRFQRQLRLGEPNVYLPAELPGSDEAKLAELWRVTGIPPEFAELGCGGPAVDHVPGAWTPPKDDPLSWVDRLAIGLASAASEAVYTAGTVRPEVDADNPWEQARRWFVTAYPLLGALAAGFKIVADADLARSWEIEIAAVNAEMAEIYVNPLYQLSDEERRFVLAHEMLHAALRHGERIGPRDAYLWNIAADFVVNGWLVEMGVGHLPDGCLYDPTLKGRGVEDVYDELAKNLRRNRKLGTLRGRGKGDMIARPVPGEQERARASDLDDFYRRALLGGYGHHLQHGRGFLPAGFVEEIRVLEHPPPPWDVQLAQWFDRFFQPLEQRRSYVRASRRQASTPDIPRPGWHRPEIPVRERTFGVVLDTSGSMDPQLLGKALGAIASYAVARDVPAARVVFCDAAAYDAGYLPVDEIAGRVRVRGRGGTVLQPGVDLLERAADFPGDGPILVITDGECDVVRVRREHAFLVPRWARLPFHPRGEVFRLQ